MTHFLLKDTGGMCSQQVVISRNTCTVAFQFVRHRKMILQTFGQQLWIYCFLEIVAKPFVIPYDLINNRINSTKWVTVRNDKIVTFYREIQILFHKSLRMQAI